MEIKLSFTRFWKVFVSSGVDMKYGEARENYKRYCNFIDKENIKNA